MLTEQMDNQQAFNLKILYIDVYIIILLYLADFYVCFYVCIVNFCNIVPEKPFLGML